jgi:hypothetical protein
VPATRQVDIGWQIIFTFVPILNLWAFYRIRKLQNNVMFIIIPQIAIMAIIAMYTSRSVMLKFVNPPLGLLWPDLWPGNAVALSTSGLIASCGLGMALQALTIYFIIIWSREHNRKFDQPVISPSS